jgi:ubiquinone biosynthesis protein
LTKLSKDIKINFTPIKSGTIGIIFIGTYKGNKVIIKTKRNNIKKKLCKSLSLFNFIGDMCNYIPILNTFNIKYILSKNSKNLLDQINYDIEFNNINIFYDYFKDFKNIVIPKTYSEFSNSEILTMDFLEGISLNKLNSQESDSIKKQLLNFCEFFNESLYNFNIIHSDLHPGNVIFMNDKIGIIDFGLIKKINSNDTLLMYYWFIGLQSKNYKKFLNIIFNKLTNKINENKDIPDISNEFVIILKALLNEKIPSVSEFLNINKYLFKHNLKLKENFLSLIINMSPQIDMLKILSLNNEDLLRKSFLKTKNKLILNKIK